MGSLHDLVHGMIKLPDCLMSKRGTVVGYTDVEEKDTPPQVSSQGSSQTRQLKVENGVAKGTNPYAYTRCVEWDKLACTLS